MPSPTIATLSTPQPARHPQPTVKAERLAHLIFERPDMARAETFLSDFGLVVVSRDANHLYLRGTGSAPYCYHVRRGTKAGFVGLGLALGSRAELEAIGALPGASAIERSTAPGGGERVRLRDPSGFLVEAVFGQTAVEPLAHRQPLQLNLGQDMPRINSTQRIPTSPPDILKLGHVVLEVADYQATCAWYTRHFGFIPSDVQVLPDGSPAVTFLRLDRGDVATDHHTLALAQGFMPAYSHSAFEVVDADAVGMGQSLLRERGWKHAWGIGRHILGSQIFDYWQDPWGDKHEHYCDGDLFTAERRLGVHAISAQAMAQWGERMPRSFTRPRLSLAALRALLHHLRHSPDVTLRKLVTLARLFA
ncbi:MAG: VOC family protein [Pseudomonas sp.]